MAKSVGLECLKKGDIFSTLKVSDGIKLKAACDAYSAGSGSGEPSDEDFLVKITASVPAQKPLVQPTYLRKSEIETVIMALSYADAQKQEALMGGGGGQAGSCLPPDPLVKTSATSPQQRRDNVPQHEDPSSEFKDLAKTDEDIPHFQNTSENVPKSKEVSLGNVV